MVKQPEKEAVPSSEFTGPFQYQETKLLNRKKSPKSCGDNCQVEDSEHVTVASSWGAGDLFTYGQEKTTNKARAGRSEKDDGAVEGREGLHLQPQGRIR